MNHPLAEALLTRARNRELPTAEIHFDYGRHDGKVSILEPYIGNSGWLSASVFTVESLDQAEDNLILAAVTDGGRILDEETATRLLSLPGRVTGILSGQQYPEGLDEFTIHRQATIQRVISVRNARFFEAEADKLDGWADDLKIGLEREIKELDRQIKEARRASTIALTLEEKLAGQKQVKALEAQRNQKRRSLFDAQDEVDRQREGLIALIQSKLQQQIEEFQLFVLRWVIH
jgi:adenine-specific DNA-methyltransferase